MPEKPFAQTDVDDAPRSPYSGHWQPIIGVDPLGPLNRLRYFTRHPGHSGQLWQIRHSQLLCGFWWLILTCLGEPLCPFIE